MGVLASHMAEDSVDGDERMGKTTAIKHIMKDITQG
jgi:hypothetical protein